MGCSDSRGDSRNKFIGLELCQFRYKSDMFLILIFFCSIKPAMPVRIFISCPFYFAVHSIPRCALMSSHKKYLNILSWNVRGLNNIVKRSIFFGYLNSLHADILFLQETHIKHSCDLDANG